MRAHTPTEVSGVEGGGGGGGDGGGRGGGGGRFIQSDEADAGRDPATREAGDLQIPRSAEEEGS